MIIQIYSIHDIKASAYMTPFFMQTEGMALRAITDCVNDNGHSFNKHPEDFTLFEMGTFDDNNGQMELLETPRPIAKCIELVSGEHEHAN